MNNDTNNNFNGQVLGSVNNTPNGNNNVDSLGISNTQMQPETLDTLDTSMVMGNNIVNDQPIQSDLGTQNNNYINMNEGITSNSVNPTQNVVNSNPVNPEPAYTNPQSINTMPGFDNPGTIGTTPPISLEPEKKPKKKQNKTLFVVIIIIVLFGIGFGTYYVLKYTDLLNSSPKIDIVTKDLEINIGDKLSTNTGDYATITGTDIKNCSLSTIDVDTTKEGIYNYTITCGEIYRTGKVTVVDNRELEISTKKVYKVKNDTLLDPKEFIEDSVDSYSYEFVDIESVNTYLSSDPGTYKVKIKVTAGNKTTEVEAELVILEYAIKGYLVCESKEQNVNDLSAIMTVKDKFAIVDSNVAKNIFGNVATEEYNFKFTDETEYTTFLAQSKTSSEITINGITGKPSFDDTNLTITISKDISNIDIASEYGVESTFSAMKTYFSATLGYSCTYVK